MSSEEEDVQKSGSEDDNQDENEVVDDEEEEDNQVLDDEEDDGGNDDEEEDSAVVKDKSKDKKKAESEEDEDNDENIQNNDESEEEKKQKKENKQEEYESENEDEEKVLSEINDEVVKKLIQIKKIDDSNKKEIINMLLAHKIVKQNKIPNKKQENKEKLNTNHMGKGVLLLTPFLFLSIFPLKEIAPANLYVLFRFCWNKYVFVTEYFLDLLCQFCATICFHFGVSYAILLADESNQHNKK